jgi:hypothetical protein
VELGLADLGFTHCLRAASVFTFKTLQQDFEKVREFASGCDPVLFPH